jgi:hypothetical protein
VWSDAELTRNSNLVTTFIAMHAHAASTWYPVAVAFMHHSQALAQATAGRTHILSQMERCSPPPARGLSKWAPRVVQMTVPADRLGALIGPVSDSLN